jgi:putative DNA primase/helicase
VAIQFHIGELTMSYDTIQSFTVELLNYDIQTASAIIDDGKLQRAHVIGDKKGSKNLAYILHNDNNPSGWFCYFSKGISGNWTASGKPRKLTQSDIKQIEQAKKQRAEEQAQAHKVSAIKANLTWQVSTPATTHPYLTKKGIQPHSARILGTDLVIALWNEQRAISTLQYIDVNGGKRFLTGGAKKSCFVPIGKPTDKILVCEGFATGASLHEDSGNFVACAMDSGNLADVARVMRRLFKQSEIIICGDNDSNQVGQNAAKAAAMVCGGSYLIPPIEGYDWNDYLTMAGV